VRGPDASQRRPTSSSAPSGDPDASSVRVTDRATASEVPRQWHPAKAAVHISTVIAVWNWRLRRRHRNRLMSRSVRADRHRGGNPAATRRFVQVPQNRATVPGATPISRQNRSSVTFGPVRAARRRNSARKSWAAFMGGPVECSTTRSRGVPSPRMSSSLLPYRKCCAEFWGLWRAGSVRRSRRCQPCGRFAGQSITGPGHPAADRLLVNTAHPRGQCG